MTKKLPELSTWTISRTKDDSWEAIGVEDDAKIPKDKSLDTVIQNIEARYNAEYAGTSEIQYAIYPSAREADIKYIFQITTGNNTFDAGDIQGSSIKVTAPTLDELVAKIETQVEDPAASMLQWVQPVKVSAGSKQAKKQGSASEPIISGKALMYYSRFHRPRLVSISLFKDRIEVTAKSETVLAVALHEIDSVKRGTQRISFRVAGKFYNFSFKLEKDASSNIYGSQNITGVDVIIQPLLELPFMLFNRRTDNKYGVAPEWQKALQNLGVEVKTSLF